MLITQESGCYARLREERETHRFRASAPQVEPVSAVGSGDVLLAAFLAARIDDKSAEESLKIAVATGTASTLEVGAGRFAPREVGRLVGAVEVRELETVAAES